jgi:hypothetical protein
MAFAAAYSASVTASWNSVAPMVVLRGLSIFADEAVARCDLEHLPVLMLMPDPPPVRREHDDVDVHVVGLGKDRIEHTLPVAVLFSSRLE